MGFNKRKMEDQRRDAAEKEAASRRATDPQVLEDAERLIAAWNGAPGACGRRRGSLVVTALVIIALDGKSCFRCA